MRDYRKLQAFQLANTLALMIYDVTGHFPREEMFGLTSQMRRAAVSIGSNIAEGAARTTQREYVRFLDIALGSASELEFQISLSTQLGYLQGESSDKCNELCSRTAKTLNGLIRSYRDTGRA